MGDTSTQTQNTMNAVAAYNSTLPKFSTEQSPNANGRRLAGGAPATDSAIIALSSSTPTAYADWRRQLSAKTAFSGTALLHLWVGAPSGSLGGFSLKVVVYGGSGSGTVLGSNTVTSTSTCGGLQEVYVQVPLTTTSLNKNAYLQVRVVNTGSSAVQLGYDATPYNSFFTASEK